MTLQSAVHEFQRRHEREIAREYAKQGYEVIVNPTPDQLPNFLAAFPIDILARNDAESVVIEVRTQGSLTSSPELDAIAKALEDRPGWRFELVVRNPRDRDSLYFRDAMSLDVPDIVSRLNEARELSEQEHGEAALLLAWSATEALLRYLADAETIPVVGHEPGQVIKSLYTYGVINQEQYQVLQEGLDARNMIVHGYKERHSLVDTVKRLLHIADQLQGQNNYSR